MKIGVTLESLLKDARKRFNSGEVIKIIPGEDKTFECALRKEKIRYEYISESVNGEYFFDLSSIEVISVKERNENFQHSKKFFYSTSNYQ